MDRSELLCCVDAPSSLKAKAQDSAPKDKQKNKHPGAKDALIGELNTCLPSYTILTAQGTLNIPGHNGQS